MEYEGRICRAPMERASFMLPVMVGCSYNKCKFCNLFRRLKYRELPLEQIEAELLRVKRLGGSPKTVFLGDGSAFDLHTTRLLEILNLIHAYFPACSAINADATVSGILKKTEEELAALYAGGMRHLYIGIESGLDDVLRFMQKDHTMAQAEKAVTELHKHGYFFDAHIMTGVAGAGRGTENAEALAAFLNRTHPARVINFSMFLHGEVPLYKDVLNGRYEPADELANLKEEERLLELLGDDENRPVSYDGFHDFLQFRVRGLLPQDREKMLTAVRAEIAAYENTEPEYAFVHGDCTACSLKKDDGSGYVWEPAKLEHADGEIKKQANRVGTTSILQSFSAPCTKLF